MEENTIQLDIDKLRSRKIFLATPMYGASCSGFYTKSLLDFSSLCIRYGIELRFFALFNESLITRARNYAADEFMRSDCTDLLFVDSDIEFNSFDVLALLHYSQDEDKPIIGGPYPKKSISWEKVKMAVDKGIADENPFVLERFAGDFVFNPVSGAKEISLNKPAEVSEIGTGFMLIRRDVFEAWNTRYPEYLYIPDHVRSKNFDGTRKIMAYFMDPLDPQTLRHLSEDYWFCHQSRKIGLKVWLCPWMQVNHIGTYKFVGDLSAIATIGAPATADLDQVKGLKK